MFQYRRLDKNSVYLASVYKKIRSEESLYVVKINYAAIVEIHTKITHCGKSVICVSLAMHWFCSFFCLSEVNIFVTPFAFRFSSFVASIY